MAGIVHSLVLLPVALNEHERDDERQGHVRGDVQGPGDDEDDVPRDDEKSESMKAMCNEMAKNPEMKKMCMAAMEKK